MVPRSGVAAPAQDAGSAPAPPVPDDLAKRQAEVGERVRRIERLRAQLRGANEAEADRLRRQIAALRAEAETIAGDAGVPLGRMLQCEPGDTPCSDL